MLSTALLLLLATQSTGISQVATAPQRIAVGDLDGNGRDDAYLASPAGGRLLLRDPDGRLVPAPPYLAPIVPGREAAWRDVDDDGDLDLLVWGADPGHLLLNEEGALRDATGEAGLGAVAAISRSMEWLDMDADGREDLVLFTDGGPIAYRNLGGAHFENFGFAGLDGMAAAPAPPVTAVSAKPVLDEAAPPFPDRPENATPSTTMGASPTVSPTAPTAPTTPTSPRRSVRTSPSTTSPNSTSTAPLQLGGSCAARIRDAIQGGCLRASATPTLGMLMPLSTDFNVDAATGFVGLGTTLPSTRLQIAGSGDVSVQGGGLLQLGSDSGQNIGIDANEMMARNNGAPSPLYLNIDGGNVIVSGNGTGKLGVGTSYPTGRLHVVDAAGGDGSVVLPAASISATELESEPGIASASRDGTTSVGLNGLIATPILTRALNAPTAGYVIATCHVYTGARAGLGTSYSTWINLETSSATPASPDASILLQPNEYGWLSWTKVFQVPAGSTTFYLLGQGFEVNASPSLSTQTSAREAILTLQFFPTAYGFVQ